MALDQTTEIVSHFIGIFEIGTEEARLKETYAAFRALQDQAPELGDLLNIGVAFSAAYKLGTFMPQGAYAPTFLPIGSVQLAGSIVVSMLDSGSAAEGGFSLFSVNPQVATTNTEPFGIYYGETAPAGSVVTITYQTNTLNDGDIITVNGLPPIAIFADDSDRVEAATTIAESLSVISSYDPMEAEGTGADFAMAALSQIEDATVPAIEGIQATLLKSDDAVETILVNGESVEEMPTLEDILPAYLQADETDDDETISEVEDGETRPENLDQVVTLSSLIEFLRDDADDDDRDDEDDADDDDDEDNEASFVLSDPPDDTVESDDGSGNLDDGHQITSGANQLVNEAIIVNSWLDAPIITVAQDVISINAISQINVVVEADNIGVNTVGGTWETQASNAINAAEITQSSSPQVEQPDNVSDGTPPNWFVTRIEGDVTVFNWLEQYNFVLDNDNVQVELSGGRSEFVLGENNAVNVASIATIGFGYDLITIAGHMIEVSIINQVNVLIDHDTVTYGSTAPDNVSASDNLAFNLARISNTGIDSYAALEGDLSNATRSLSEGDNPLPGGLNDISAFSEQAFVRVLHIEGDFVSVNSIEQRNILGDSDHVQMVLDDFVGNASGDISVTAGSNALLNIATITNAGVDSSVYVGGDVYSEALLYQAELIDAAAAPTGIGVAVLANEAVAFLAEGLIGEDAPAEESLVIEGLLDGGGTSPDVMTSMLV
ncbi:hypothetical protein C1J03_06220 [Sulfitobacter sp. SK012]|uniref:hypothetical protein n=1 Tax=Sulfitobacter sp. SK012 TaxID=1389005 RepID=UPI000E0BC010|nr:hypothetical protein [Sulfitobacter sp. SK012]AXI45667.1 hypothetical protein C1J03_06220 [Sulfitobacter sp. SK012]